MDISQLKPLQQKDNIAPANSQPPATKKQILNEKKPDSFEKKNTGLKDAGIILGTGGVVALPLSFADKISDKFMKFISIRDTDKILNSAKTAMSDISNAEDAIKGLNLSDKQADKLIKCYDNEKKIEKLLKSFGKELDTENVSVIKNAVKTIFEYDKLWNFMNRLNVPDESLYKIAEMTKNDFKMFVKDMKFEGFSKSTRLGFMALSGLMFAGIAAIGLVIAKDVKQNK